jgi:hypothetical protein
MALLCRVFDEQRQVMLSAQQALQHQAQQIETLRRSNALEKNE